MSSIRRASEDDAKVISTLNADVQAVHAAAMPWRFKPPGPDTFPPDAAKVLLADPRNLVFLAEVDEVPAGYAYAEIVRRPDTARHYAHAMLYMHHLSVRPEFRRRGIGRALIDAMRDAGLAIDIDTLVLDVWSFNEEARAFFRDCGLQPFNERLWNR